MRERPPSALRLRFAFRLRSAFPFSLLASRADALSEGLYARIASSRDGVRLPMALFGADGGQRRRRVLTEQLRTTSATAERAADSDEVAGSTAHAPSYAEETLAGQPSLLSFVAQRYTTLALWLLLAALVVVGLETAYVHLADLRQIAAAEQLAALDLAMPGNLGSWYSSLLLALAAAGSLTIYSVRRHKVDDYSGRYRIWLWAAAAWLVLSADATAQFHRILPPLGAHLTRVEGWAGGEWWWLGPAVVLYGALGLRLLIELRHCRLATAALVLAFGCWACAIVARLGGLPVLAGELATVVRSATTMAGHVLLLTALGLYARHVVLDARGELPLRPAKPKREKNPRRRKAQPDAEEEPAEPAESKKPAKLARTKTEPAHKSPPAPAGRSDLDEPPAPRRRAKPETAWTDGGDEEADWEDDSSAGSRKLTKAERRRLRKQARQDHS